MNINDQTFEIDQILALNAPDLDALLGKQLLDYQFTNIFQIYDSLINGNLQLETWQHRIMLHYYGLCYVFKGSLNKARLVLENASQTELGANIGIIRDLSAVYYQMGEIDRWRQEYHDLKDILIETHGLLSEKVKLSCELMLAKYYEEEGAIRGALEAYEESLHSITELGEIVEKQLNCLAQIIRLKSLFRQNENLGSQYKRLISLRLDNVSKDLSFEVNHALMLAELSLIGSQHSWTRVVDSLKDEEICAADQRLIYFDFLEESLLRKLKLPDDFNDHLPDMEGADRFETEVHRLYFERSDRLDLASLNRLAPELSWANYLRLLSLYFVIEDDEGTKTEINNKLNLILGAVEAESRPFWVERIRPFLQSDDLQIRFNRSTRTIYYQNKELDLSRKRGMLAILEQLTEHPKMTVEELIDRIWNCEYSPEHYHRLRMTVHRLNRQLFDLTSISKTVEINSDQVSVKPSVSFVVE